MRTPGGARAVALPPLVRRGTALLGGSFALTIVAFSMAAGPGSAALVQLTGDLRYAGAYFALYLVLAAAGSGLGGRAMDAWGRRPVLVAAHLGSAAGFAVAGFGVAAGSLGAFAAGVAVFALAGGANGLTRLAAGDLYPPAQRGRGMAWVVASATAGAVLGPLLLLASEPAAARLGGEAAHLVWFFAPPLFLAAAALVALAPEPARVARDLAAHWPGVDLGPPQDPRAEARLPRGPLLAGGAALAGSLAAMTAVMSVAGAAVAHAGHGYGVLGAVMTAHYLGMYATALGVGRFADRAGRRPTILAGAVVLALGGGVVVAWPGMAGLAAGLFLIGLGWCFSSIGATVLLADVAPLHLRARVVGRADLVASLLAAVASAASGPLLAAGGLAGVGALAALIMAVPALALAPLREPRPGVYGPEAPAPA